LRDFNPVYVGYASTSAVSRFLRHGCFTPETGHWLARLARPKNANNGRERVQQWMQPEGQLLDHLVGGREQRRRHLEAERPGGLEIDG
jgi:hypothetical protein